MSTISKLGADMLTVPRDLFQDLIDDVADYAVSRTFKDRETTWRSDLLKRADELLARQPAAIDKEAVFGWVQENPGAPDKPHFILNANGPGMTHDRVSVYAAPLDKEADQQTDAASDLAFSVYSGINALRWLLNITTEFDRKDVRTRQAARLLDEYTDSFGKTNRERLEAMWKALNDSLPDDGRINEYLRAHDAAGRALKAKGSSK